MGEIIECRVNEGVMNGEFPNCIVCKERFKLGENIVLAPVQQPTNGYATVMCIPIHSDCFWVK